MTSHERHSALNHKQIDCLWNTLFKLSKKIISLAPCEGNKLGSENLSTSRFIIIENTLIEKAKYSCLKKLRVWDNLEGLNVFSKCSHYVSETCANNPIRFQNTMTLWWMLVGISPSITVLGVTIGNLIVEIRWWSLNGFTYFLSWQDGILMLNNPRGVSFSGSGYRLFLGFGHVNCIRFC